MIYADIDTNVIVSPLYQESEKYSHKSPARLSVGDFLFMRLKVCMSFISGR